MTESLAAVWHVLSAPFPLFLLIILGAAVFTDWKAGRRASEPPHVHQFRRRHPAGVWTCESCPETRDRHGKPIRRG